MVPDFSFMITFRSLGQLGRFGNQLFQYAGTRLYAETHGFAHAFPTWIGAQVFNNIATYTLTEQLLASILPTIQLDDIQSYGVKQKIAFALGLSPSLPHTVSLSSLYAHPRDHKNLFGYLQDHKSLSLLAQHKEKVRTWFSFHDKISSAYTEATRNLSPWIGVHVRRGDLVKRGVTVPLHSFLEKLDSVRNGRPVFVASDDPNMHSEFAHCDPIRIRNPLPEVPREIFDFWMLTQSSAIIGCGSTFSWWAAYISGTQEYYAPLLTHLWPAGYIPVLEQQSI